MDHLLFQYLSYKHWLVVSANIDALQRMTKNSDGRSLD